MAHRDITTSYYESEKKREKEHELMMASLFKLWSKEDLTPEENLILNKNFYIEDKRSPPSPMDVAKKLRSEMLEIRKKINNKK